MRCGSPEFHQGVSAPQSTPLVKAANADQGCPPALITSLQIIMDLLSVRVGLLNLWRNTTVHNH